jgi:hypothetical protein
MPALGSAEADYMGMRRLTHLQTGIAFQGYRRWKVATPPVPDDDHQSYFANKSKWHQLFLSANQKERSPPCGGEAKTTHGFWLDRNRLWPKRTSRNDAHEDLRISWRRTQKDTMHGIPFLLNDEAKERMEFTMTKPRPASTSDRASIAACKQNFELFKMRRKPFNTWATPDNTAGECRCECDRGALLSWDNG